MALKRVTLSKITVRGFKSIDKEQGIEIRPLTILAGANSSGKSSIMQPLLLLKQTLESTEDPGALRLDGGNVKFTKFEQLLSKNRDEFEIKLELKNCNFLSIVFKRDETKECDISMMKFNHNKDIISLKQGINDIISKVIRLLRLKELHKPLIDLLNIKESDVKYKVTRNRCFLKLEAYRSDSEKQESSPISFFNYDPGNQFIPHIMNIIHLPGLRGNPQRTYSKNATGKYFPGTFEDYAASLIFQWQKEKDQKIDQLKSALEELGLTWKVKAEPVDDTQIAIFVGRLNHPKRAGAHDLVNISDVGFGVSQVLPVLVALIAANPGKIVYIEQPEIHLHPKAQRKLAHIIINTAKRGVIVILETHSSLLLKEFQTLVAKDEITKDSVILHWFQRNKDGITEITSTELDEYGAFDSSWPSDFDDVELETEKEYLDTIEQKRWKK